MAWFDHLKGLFQGESVPDKHLSEDEHPELLRVLLLLEAAGADNDFAEQERALIKRLLVEKYALPEAEFETLLGFAREKRASQVDVYAFTREMSNRLSAEAREELMLELWQVMFADEKLDAEEEYLARKFQKLLKLDHTSWVRAKLAAKNAKNEAT